ncbi:MAG: HAD hydrolase-like protein, partial [Collinsella intestinalis]|nr:HAD hydrolase-like protein [Collinsella intestinalis]
YVGDSNVDIACGHNAGMRSCGVAWGFRGRAELEGAGADYVIDTPEELLGIVL